MFLLRAALVLGGLAVLTCLMMAILTGQRAYLRWAGRVFLVVLLLVLAALGMRFGGRLAGIAGF